MQHLACHVARPGPEHVHPWTLQYWEHRGNNHQPLTAEMVWTRHSYAWWPRPKAAVLSTITQLGSQWKRYRFFQSTWLGVFGWPKWRHLCHQQIALFNDNRLDYDGEMLHMPYIVRHWLFVKCCLFILLFCCLPQSWSYIACCVVVFVVVAWR